MVANPRRAARLTTFWWRWQWLAEILVGIVVFVLNIHGGVLIRVIALFIIALGLVDLALGRRRRKDRLADDHPSPTSTAGPS